MPSRGMAFRFDLDNQALKELDGNFSKSEENSTEQWLTLNFADCHGDLDYVQLYVRSVECCGWLEVSGNLGRHLKSTDLKLLKLLMKEPLILNSHFWSKVKEKPTRFPLFCVVTDKQKGVKQWLIDHKWQQMSEWVNPNTGNICTSFFYPIDQEETDNDGP